jgi:hypothetical protein
LLAVSLVSRVIVMTDMPTKPETPTADAALAEIVNIWMDAWNEGDSQRRRSLVGRSWAPDGRYFDPFLAAQGPDAISASLGQLRESFPGYFVRRKSGIETHFEWLRFAWELVDPEGSVVSDGVDVAERCGDGQFQQLVTFVSQVVPVPLEG